MIQVKNIVLFGTKIVPEVYFVHFFRFNRSFASHLLVFFW